MAIKLITLILVLISCFGIKEILSLEKEDFYTSIAGLEYLLEDEMAFVETLENYLKETQKIKQKILSSLEEVEKHRGNQTDLAEYFKNPLNSLKIIKRSYFDWKSLRDLILLDRNSEVFVLNVTKLSSGDFTNATVEDLRGASNGLVRLQSTYALSAQDLADGILMDYMYDSKLSAHDCFELGRNLYELGNFKYATDWLFQARFLLRNQTEVFKKEKENIIREFPHLSHEDILEVLVASLYNEGNWKMAITFNEELLALDPSNEYGLADKELFEMRAMFERSSLSDRNKDLEGSEEKEKMPYVDQIYAEICRGDIKQSPREQRNLRCRLTSKNVPFRLIAPFKMEELNHEPFIAVYHDAIYESEMSRIINENENSVERSGIDESDDEGDIHAGYSEVRTSKNTWLDFKEHKFLEPLKQRLQDITGLSFLTAEPLQVANYGIGGHYAPHYDFSTDPDTIYPGEGNRILTALFYINEPELGGSTAFPFLRLAVPPIKGSLLVWFNVHESLEPDYRTNHAGCPVLKGSKWICNEWFHQLGQEFNLPCSLERQGHKSLPYAKLT